MNDVIHCGHLFQHVVKHLNVYELAFLNWKNPIIIIIISLKFSHWQTLIRMCMLVWAHLCVLYRSNVFQLPRQEVLP